MLLHVGQLLLRRPFIVLLWRHVLLTVACFRLLQAGKEVVGTATIDAYALSIHRCAAEPHVGSTEKSNAPAKKEVGADEQSFGHTLADASHE